MIEEDLPELYATVGDYENFIKNYDPEMFEELTTEYQLTRNVIYGILNNYEFAKKMYENKEKLELNYPIFNHICCRFILSGEFDDYLIKNHPPHCLTYPEILNDEIFEKLFKKYKKELEPQLAILCIIKNKIDKYMELNPKPNTLVYNFAEYYNKPECMHQQKSQNEKFNQKHLTYNTIFNENIYTERYIKVDVIKYSTYFNDLISLGIQKCSNTEYETLSDLFGCSLCNMGELGFNTFNNYRLYYTFNKNIQIHNHKTIVKEKELYKNIFQVFEVFRNLEKYNNELCKLAISKLIIMHIDVDNETVEKYKPFDFTIENTWYYAKLIKKYPKLEKELLEGKQKFEKIMKEDLL